MKPKRKMIQCMKLLAILHKLIMTLNKLVWQVSVLTWSDGNAFASTKILCLSEVGL